MVQFNGEEASPNKNVRPTTKPQSTDPLANYQTGNAYNSMAGAAAEAAAGRSTTAPEEQPYNVTIWSGGARTPGAVAGANAWQSRTATINPEYSRDEQIAAFWDDPNFLSADERAYVTNAAKQVYGNSFQPFYVPGFWMDAFKSAERAGVDVFEIIQQQLKDSRVDGGGNESAGGGGGTLVSYDFTAPDVARTIVDTSLKNYLGRAATADEIAQFTAALKAEEQANPTVVSRSGSTQTQTGGVDAQIFARDWAAKQEGAAEYQVASRYLDLFLGALG